MIIRRFEDIEGWQLARELTRQVYAVAMHNIAEGFDGGSNAEFVKFLRYSQRSCSEVQSQLYVALDCAYITQPEFDAIYEQASRTHAKVGAFIHYLLNAPPR